MAYALLNYSKFRDAQDAARINNTSIVDEYKKLGGKIFEGSNVEVENCPKAFAVFDEEKPAKKKLRGARKTKLGRRKK